MRKWLLTPLALLPVLLLPEAHAESPEAKGLAIAEEMDKRYAGWVDQRAKMTMVLKNLDRFSADEQDEIRTSGDRLRAQFGIE